MLVKFCVVAPLFQAYVKGNVPVNTFIVIEPLALPQEEFVDEIETDGPAMFPTTTLVVATQLLLSVTVTL